MNDDLKHLKSLMDDATPKPDAVRRAANMTLAQDNFVAFQQARVTIDGAPVETMWQRATVWLQSGPAKGVATASVLIVAGSLFLSTPPNTDQLSAPLKMAESAQEGLVAEFAAPAQMIAADDAPAASRAAAPSARSATPSTSFDAIRAALSRGVLPQQSDVRIAEMIDAFTYDSDNSETEADFAAAIESFGLLLRDPQALGDNGYDEVIARAQASLGPDISGLRAEAVALMQLAKDLSQ